MPEDDDLTCPDCGEVHHLGYFITVPMDATWFIPASGEGGTDVKDYDRMGVMLEPDAILELWDAFGAIVEREAKEGRL